MGCSFSRGTKIAADGSGVGSGRATPFALPRDAPGAVTTLLSVLHGAHSVGAGVFGFLTTREARALRLVSHECREAVAAARWHDAGTLIGGSLKAWRACFPGAVAANVGWRWDVTDADFEHLVGVKVVAMWNCAGITDTGLAHLRGIHTLDMSHCTGVTDAGLAHLGGVHTLDMSYCTGVTDAGLAHLRGIHTLGMRYCTGITPDGLAHLHGIHTLEVHGCAPATVTAACAMRPSLLRG